MQVVAEADFDEAQIDNVVLVIAATENRRSTSASLMPPTPVTVW